MKTAPRFHLGSTQPPVNAYQREDIQSLRHFITHAENLWYDEWVKQGSKEEGTCCGGKGISVWFIGPRKRSAEPRNIIACRWVQGNLSASRSVQPALDYLKECGIEAEYNDGWMS
jgi:hypothetical protein